MIPVDVLFCQKKHETMGRKKLRVMQKKPRQRKNGEKCKHEEKKRRKVGKHEEIAKEKMIFSSHGKEAWERGRERGRERERIEMRERQL